MSIKLVALKYTFMFDPSESWQHLYQFEDFMANYFAAYGYQAEDVKVVTGPASEHMLLISKIEPMVKNQTQQAPQKESSPKTLNELRDPKTYGKSK